MNKCPCIECICKPMCYRKHFNHLINDCYLISNYYYFSKWGNFEKRLKTIVEIINPLFFIKGG